MESESDEVVIPDGITAISYTLTEDDQEITREIEVEPTDTVKYYKEEDGYYTLAIYDNTGAIKSKGYTMHSDNVPNISISYSEEENNKFTASDEYNGYVPLTEVDYSADTEFVVPAGVTKIEYSAGDSGARIAEVEEGDILEYTADPNDSTKFTLTVYDKDKNKKRDLYTWNNDNLHFSYGTSVSHSSNSEDAYEDNAKTYSDSYFLYVGDKWTVPFYATKAEILAYEMYNGKVTKIGKTLITSVNPGDVHSVTKSGSTVNLGSLMSVKNNYFYWFCVVTGSGINNLSTGWFN
ncbi:MAG: hypothetical protein ACI3T9_06660 [Romboutsia timonensis]